MVHLLSSDHLFFLWDYSALGFMVPGLIPLQLRVHIFDKCNCTLHVSLMHLPKEKQYGTKRVGPLKKGKGNATIIYFITTG